MKFKNLSLSLLAVAAIMIGQVSSANAYFTTYVTAKGGYDVSWWHEENITENFHDWQKNVRISSKEGSIDVFVRAKAFAGDTYQLEYAGSDWSYNAADGYYYYTKPLKGGETTPDLLISIKNIPLDVEIGDNLNVVVIYETIPAKFNEDGTAKAPDSVDWTGAAAVTQEGK